MTHGLIGHFAQVCNNTSFFGLPTWYKYLEQVPNAAGCAQPVLNSIWDVWLVAAAVLEMLVRIAAMIAVAFIVWGGIKYITSKGDPNSTKTAQATIINALVGLVISISASAVISFVAGRVN